jgi:hypothetical protein
MVELCLWPSIILLRKLANILQLHRVHSTYNIFLCTRATKEGKNIKPTINPLQKSWHSSFHLCRKPPSYVPYKGTYVPYDGTFGPDQGQMLDV